MAAPMAYGEISNIVSVLHEKLNTEYSSVNFDEINEILSSILPVTTSINSRLGLDQSFFTDIESLLEKFVLTPEPNTDQQVCITNCFRVCRNLCAVYTDHQSTIHNSPSFIEHTHNILSKCVKLERKTEAVYVLLRCAVQFLGNYCSGHYVNKAQVLQKFHNHFRSFLELEDDKLREYTFMVVHLTLTDTPGNEVQEWLGNDLWELLFCCIQVAAESESENGLRVVEDCLKIKQLYEQVYHRLSLHARILLLEVLINSLKRLPEDNLPTTSDSPQADDIPAADNIHFIAADFLLQAHLIPNMKDGSDDHSQVLCSVKELECLCIASSHYKLYQSLQDNDQLVKTSLSLLHCIEEIGRQGDNIFSTMDKMSNIGDVNTDHPVFGLKRDLIRLLGNMAYRHKHNQDMIRELDGLPLILDQTNIDGRNPYITQWSVFAIHNLTEDNEANRQYIAELKLQGVANNQAVLKEMGLETVIDGEKVTVKKKKTT